MFALTQSLIIEKPVRFECISVSGDIEVLAYSEMVLDAAGIQIAQPLVTNELSVCHKVCSGVFTGYPFEAIDQVDAFLGIGVAVLVHHRIDDRECHTIVDDSENEDINVRVAVFPVGPVHRKIVRAFDRY